MLKRTFDLFDMDNNGEISSSELQERLSTFLGGRDVSQEEMDYLMTVVFDDKNAVQPADFMHSLQRDEEMEYEDARDELFQVFRQLDHSGDGQITQQELQKGLEKLIGVVLTDEECESFFKDTKDAAITFDQFLEAILS